MRYFIYKHIYFIYIYIKRKKLYNMEVIYNVGEGEDIQKEENNGCQLIGYDDTLSCSNLTNSQILYSDSTSISTMSWGETTVQLINYINYKRELLDIEHGNIPDISEFDNLTQEDKEIFIRD